MLLGNKPMPNTHPDHDPENPLQESYYEIQVKGQLVPRWEEWFKELTVTTLDNHEFILSGPIPDQAALHGLITKLRDLNLELIYVKKKK